MKVHCPAIESVRTKHTELLNSCDGDKKKLMPVQSDQLAWSVSVFLRAIDAFNRVIQDDTAEDVDVDGEQPS